jgi:hypothetical protein
MLKNILFFKLFSRQRDLKGKQKFLKKILHH